MLGSLFKSKSKPDLYIDLGTANTLIAARERGVIVNEPSVIAYNELYPGKKNIVAVGNEAREKIAKTPGNLFAARPLKEGVIADADTTESMLRLFFARPGVSHWLMKPKIIVSIPYGITDVEKQAVIDSGKAAGAREVILVDEPMAAAIGAGLPITDARGSMLIDFGGGTTEVAIIALGGIVYCSSVRVGGHRFDESIQDYAKKIKNLIIDDVTAEQLKAAVGTAMPTRTQLTTTVRGRNAGSGLSQEIEFSSREVADAIEGCVQDIIDAIKYALENTPPELLADIIDNGITLTGGGAMLRDLALRLQTEVKIPVRVAENPLTTIARGGQKLLDDPELLDRVQIEMEEP